MRSWARACLPALLAVLGAFTCAPAQATRFCDATPKLNVAQQDRILRFGAIVKAELQKSGARLALVARSGLDLSRINVRYSHAGISLLASPETPWSVRQLYYDCDTGNPRIFDQGLLAFLMGTDEPELGYLSVLLLPPDLGTALEATALDRRIALHLLAPAYSANAYAFSVQYQNCNQWLAELLATAWGALPLADTTAESREHAQRWLQLRGYTPSVVDLGWRPMMWLGAAIPWVNSDDHPALDLQQNHFRVSMPAAIEAFVQARAPGTERLEICHDSRQVVIHHGWVPVAEGCRAGDGDVVVAL